MFPLDIVRFTYYNTSCIYSSGLQIKYIGRILTISINKRVKTRYLYYDVPNNTSSSSVVIKLQVLIPYAALLPSIQLAIGRVFETNKLFAIDNKTTAYYVLEKNI